MDIIKGYFYFLKDEFFAKMNDPYLKINYETSKRPHYFAFVDEKTAKRTISMIRHGVKFTPTQPDINRIEKLLLEEEDTL